MYIDRFSCVTGKPEELRNCRSTNLRGRERGNISIIKRLAS